MELSNDTAFNNEQYYTMLSRNGKRTLKFLGHLIISILVFYILEAFLIEQLPTHAFRI